jgi:hypothetical protein
MRKREAIPPICMHCKWYNALGCMYDGALRKDFNPEIKCFEPINNILYPSPRKIIRKFFDILYKLFPKLEHEFITINGGYEDGTKFLSVLSENIKLLEEFKNEFLALQKEFHKYPRTNNDEIRYPN